jgi:hypothetical protein
MWQYGMNSSCMGFLKLCNGSWHMCKANFVASFMTTCEICDIYWLQFCTNITSWSWFYYIPHSNVKKSFFSCTRVSSAVPLIWTSFSIQRKEKCSPMPPVYLWSKVVLFLFYFITSHHITLRSPKLQCFMSHSYYLWKALNERGALTWFGIVLELCYGSYWLLNHFLNEK